MANPEGNMYAVRYDWKNACDPVTKSNAIETNRPTRPTVNAKPDAFRARSFTRTVRLLISAPPSDGCCLVLMECWLLLHVLFAMREYMQQ